MKQIRKFLELSTGNLPKFTADLIYVGKFPKPPSYINEYGWVFSVPENIKELTDEKITCSSFINIMSLAIDAGCDYVMFDRDAEPIDWLPLYDW